MPLKRLVAGGIEVVQLPKSQFNVRARLLEARLISSDSKGWPRYSLRSGPRVVVATRAAFVL
jgi:hypothetical protein